MKYFALLVAILSSAVVAQPQTEPLSIKVTFPAHVDTFAVDQLRVSGHTDPDARIYINDKQVPLLALGAFVTRVPLQEGRNEILLRAEKGDELAQDVLLIFRPPKLKTLPLEPTAIDPLWIEPEKDTWVQDGDFLTVQVKGSPGGRAVFHVERLGKDFSMVELPPRQAGGLSGVYQGTVRVKDVPANRGLKIEFELEGVNGRTERLTAPGRLYMLPPQYPVIGRLLRDSYFFGTPKGYTPKGRFEDSVRVQIIGRRFERFNVDIASRQGWIDMEDVQLEPFGTSLPRAAVAAPRLSQNSQWLQLSMPLGQRLPVTVERGSPANELTLIIHGGHQGSHWITFPNQDVDIENLSFHSEQNSLKLNVTTSFAADWGYRTFYKDGKLEFWIRRPPALNPQAPLDNIIVALDPGHGGEETGAVGPLGLMEKDVNLAWAKKCAALLRQNGAMVVLTRQDDETVSLQERIQRGEAANAHVFISLHNNSVGASGNAFRAAGTSVYFTLPQNKELCWAMYPRMVDVGLAPYGRIYNSYFVTRSTSFLVALVEGAFLSNPEEERKLLKDEFVGEIAEAVVLGLTDFFQQRAQ